MPSVELSNHALFAEAGGALDGGPYFDAMDRKFVTLRNILPWVWMLCER